MRELARAAPEGAEVGFVVFRAIRNGDLVEWVALDANASVRNRGLIGSAPGTSKLDHEEALSRSAIAPILEAALASGERFEVDHELSLPTGVSSWRRVIAIPLEHDVVAALTYDISDLVDARTRAAALSQHSSDLKVVAEGIDTDRKHRRIQRLGCHFGQGYLFARPAALDQVMRRFEATALAAPVA